MNYSADETRYDRKIYRRCGESGIQLPAISLGLWHNFGHIDDYQNSRSIALRAFDLGITHFDLANNYGPPPGSAEENFGRMMREDLRKYRDEMIISTKAGYLMWPGPYGDGGSRKYLIASLDQSLKRMGLDYVDIFYHHRPDSTTPIDETMSTLSHIVRSGKALYIGLSNYTPDLTRQAAIMLKKMGTPCLIHQPRYNMLDRWAENGLLQVLENERIGCIAYSPLAQGLLTNRYQNGIPADSRASKPHGFLKEDRVEETLPIIRKLEEIAQSRGQSLAQMALVWILRDPVVSSVLIGASSVGQLEDSFNALNNKNFRSDELERIDKILKAKYK
ncbi:MAG: L-glyceraldehyde 3-phosphate reductase [Bacteroidales bacterium]|nr:L-glyceraldehyde 3-phosphate reductase [Bacteroidales bacterium]